MKERIFTLFLGLFMVGFIQAQVVFDPATVELDSLPVGSSIVEIEGVKYAKIALDGWNSVINMHPVLLDVESTKFRTTIKYKEGNSGFTIDQVKTFFKIIGSDLIGKVKENSSSDLLEYFGDIVSIADTITSIQVAGQETVGWTAVVGDTIFLGKVVAYDPSVIFDPSWYSEGAFQGSDSMEIVSIDDENYLKVTLNGWNSVFQVSSTVMDASWETFEAKAKYEEGTSGFTTDQVKTFIKLTNGTTKIGQVKANSSNEFTTYNAPFESIGDTITNIQIAGQETVGWSSVVGDYIYLGIVKAVSSSVVEIDSIKLSVDGDAIIDTKGGVLQLIATTYPEDVSGDAIEWTVSDEALAYVSSDGLVTAFADGTIQVMAKAKDGSNVSDSIEVVITNQSTAAALNLINKLKVYPNPVNSTLHIAHLDNVLKVEMISTSGMVVDVTYEAKAFQSINVSNFKSGMYVVRVIAKGSIHTAYVIKE